MKTIFAIAAALCAVPAIAQETQTSSAPTVVAPAQGGSAAKSRETRYCYLADTTGSRIQRKECRTRDQWLARGFDPLKK